MISPLVCVPVVVCLFPPVLRLDGAELLSSLKANDTHLQLNEAPPPISFKDRLICQFIANLHVFIITA